MFIARTAALVALVWNYPLNRYFVFARHQGDEAAVSAGMDQ